MTKTGRMQKLLEDIKLFTKNRQWHEYHTPKNLAMALSVECSELVEIFQWMTPEQSAQPDEQIRKHIGEEIGDIMIYLSMIGSAFEIDPIKAAEEKLRLNEQKYPASHSI
jgi:NTP pyrophosphatase (non-canonical NTP hydrolase)